MATTRPWFCPQTDCPAPKQYHDTSHGYIDYRCRSGKAREEARIYRKRLREGRAVPGRYSNYVGIARLVRAAQLMGWPLRAIAVETGVGRHQLNKMLAGEQGYVTGYAYRRLITSGALARLANTPGPSLVTRKRAITRGYQPLMAWDDIDDPGEQPPLSYRQGEQIMELAGRSWPLARIADELGLDTEQVREHLTDTFTAEAARGLSYSQIADKFGVTITRVARQMRPVELEEIDPHLPSAVLDGSVSFNACSEREQLYVVEQLWPRVEDHENPTAELAAWLGVDPIRIVRIRATARKHARETKEAS